jgi:hypothetical protein
MIDVQILNVDGLNIVCRWRGLPFKRDSGYTINPPDITAMSKLVICGDDHAKIMRMVIVWMAIRAPRYWWQQFDTYRIGVEKLSESTMHTLMRDGATPNDFTPDTPVEVITLLNEYIKLGCFRMAKAALPEGFLQKRLVMTSYQALRRMWLQRKEHRLIEWHEFIDALRELPYADELIFCG